MGLEHDRGDQAIRDGDRHADVGTVVHPHGVAVERRVDLGVQTQREGSSAHHEIVDRDLHVGVGRTLVLDRHQGVGGDGFGNVEMRDRGLRFEQALADDLAHGRHGGVGGRRAISPEGRELGFGLSYLRAGTDRGGALGLRLFDVAQDDTTVGPGAFDLAQIELVDGGKACCHRTNPNLPARGDDGGGGRVEGRSTGDRRHRCGGHHRQGLGSSGLGSPTSAARPSSSGKFLVGRQGGDASSRDILTGLAGADRCDLIDVSEGAGGDEDFGDHAAIQGLPFDDRLVGLNLGHDLAAFDRVARLNAPTDNGAFSHGRGLGGQGLFDDGHRVSVDSEGDGWHPTSGLPDHRTSGLRLSDNTPASPLG